MLIPDLLNTLFDQSDYPLLITLGLLHKRKTTYAKKYSVFIHYEPSKSRSFEFVICKPKLVKHYIDNNVNIFNHDECPLRLCARRGHIEIVKYLCGSSIAMNKIVNAFVASASSGCMNVVKFFTNKYPDLLVHEREFALIMACSGGHLNVVEYFVRNGANVHHDNECALRWAISYGELNIVKYLVGIGADIHVLNDKPLVASVMRNQLDIAEYLIGVGANVHAIDEGTLAESRFNGCHSTVDFVEKILKLNL